MTRIPRPSPPTARTAAGIIATAGVALLAAGCGGSPGSKVPAGSAQQNGALTFSRCMRSHGVTRFPDLVPNGKSPSPTALGVSSSQFQAAQSACQHLLPTNNVDASVTLCLSSGDCPPALLHQILNEGLQFARCMRAHSVPNWPDPSRYPDDGAPIFNLLHVRGFDPRAPEIEHTMDECQHVYSPGVRVGLARS